MTQKQTGYRAFPEKIFHPDMAGSMSKDEFELLPQKTKMIEAPSLHEGHLETNIWLSDNDSYRGYVLEIKLKDKAPLYIKSMCTFTPTFGIDQVDGNLAQDIEEYFLFRELGRESGRLAIFNGRRDVPIMEYLQSRGFGEFVATSNKKKWWQFWR